MSRAPAATLILLWLTSACAQQSKVEYPRTVSEIPSEFHGRWDEITEDDCDSRESRFALGSNSLSNFEMAYDVVRVTLRSPVDIDVNARLDPAFGGPADEVWHFKLVQDGQALAAPDGKPPFYMRCPEIPASDADEEG